MIGLPFRHRNLVLAEFENLAQAVYNCREVPL